MVTGSIALLLIASPVAWAKEKPTTPPKAALAAGPCIPDGTLDATVTLTPPHDVALVGLKVTLTYPAGVSIPGDADETSVKERVQMLPGGVLYSPNDQDGHTVIALVGTEPLPSGPLATVAFDRCAGRPAPTAADFTCHVDQGSDRDGKLLLDGITCTLAAQTKKEKGR